MKARDKRNIIVLTIVALILISGFLFIGVNSVNFRYALYRRIPKIYAMILTGTAIGFSSLIFQTVTNNRILTPSILGIDSLYVLLQTTVVFLLPFLNINLYIKLENKSIDAIVIIKFIFPSLIITEDEPNKNTTDVCNNTYNESIPKILGVNILLFVTV